MSSPIHLFDPAFRANPYPFYAQMRRSQPLCQVEPAGLWAVSRHQDVVFVLKHPELFSSHGFRAAWEPEWLGYNPVARSILAMDGAPHAKLRALVTRAIGARALLRLEPRIRELAGWLAEQAARAGEVEFISAFALPLPAFVIADLLGLPRSLWTRFKHVGRMFQRTGTVTNPLPTQLLAHQVVHGRISVQHQHLDLRCEVGHADRTGGSLGCGVPLLWAGRGGGTNGQDRLNLMGDKQAVRQPVCIHHG